MFLSAIKNRLYHMIVESHPSVRAHYEGYKDSNPEYHKKHRFQSLKFLFALKKFYKKGAKGTFPTPPMQYELKAQGCNSAKHSPTPPPAKTSPKSDNKKKYVSASHDVNKAKPPATTAAPKNLPYLNGAESRSNKRTLAPDIIRTLLKYDIISFDIFDTLIFRPFSSPRDLFYLVGEKLNLFNYRNIRAKAEDSLKDQKEASTRPGNREVTIYEIYDYIEKQTGLDAQKGIAAELETEYDLCYPNPYMKYVLETMLANNKRIVLTTDMYLPAQFIEKLLKKCGFEGYEKLFVSCEYGCSKRSGELYFKVNEYLNDPSLKVIHIGDNYTSDIESAKRAGWDAHHYQNVNRLGNQYRADKMSNIIGSAYAGVVNAHIHNSFVRYDAYYEYGYLYGGLFILGYCNFIHDYALRHGMDKVLFVARDGYIMKKAYDSLYQDIPSEYIFCSRITNLKLCSYQNKHEFIKQYVTRWVTEKQEIAIEAVLKNMDLTTLISRLPSYLSGDAQLTAANYPYLIEFLDQNWQDILLIYQDLINLAKRYYSQYLENTKKVCVVDIGWRGHGALAMKMLEEDFWHFGCEITGIVAASAPTRENISQLTSGVIQAYLFSPLENFECFQFHSKHAINNILTELLVGACHPSFRGFHHGENGDYTLDFDVPEINNYTMIAKVHEGIMDFVKEYSGLFKNYPYMLHISGQDAYRPIMHIFKNYSFIKRFFKKYEFQDMVGGTSGYKSRTISDVFRKFNL